VARLISSILFCLPIHRWCKWFELKFSVITTTQFVPNSNEKCQTTNSLLNQTSWDTNNKTPTWIQSQNNLYETTYVNTRNIGITITLLVSICVPRRCNDTVDNKRLHSWELNYLYRGSWMELNDQKNAKSPWWCERCLLITESPKTPGHYRYLIWVLEAPGNAVFDWCHIF